MKKLVCAVIIAILVAGCSTLKSAGSNDLLVQYSTMKLIEQSDEVSAEGVIEATTKARLVISDSGRKVTIDKLKADIADQINFDLLAPGDRLLISTIVDRVQKNYEEERGDVEVLPDEVKVSVNEFLDQVEQAARFY